MKRAWILWFFAAALILGGAIVGWFLREGVLAKTHSVAVPSPVANAVLVAVKKADRLASVKVRAERPSATGTAQPALTEDLLFAMEEKTMSAEFRCNGRDRLRMTGTNLSSQPLRLLIPAAQTFEGANGSVVALRDRLMEFKPGEVRHEVVATLAIASGNRVEEQPCAATATPQPKLQSLFDFLSEHPEVSAAAAQTAALSILENLPASAFAKFAVAGSGVPAQWDTAAFKVDVVDLVQALIVLKGIGIPDEQLAITIDPQTRIEAMLDPLAHALAMRYYNIPAEGEWAYWKHELLEGDPGTRHYALHGIARYYPDVALQMLPQWAREARTNLVFRKAAIEALAETRRTEALPILRGLQNDLSSDAELSKAAGGAADYLESLLAKQGTETKAPVAFRGINAP